MMSLLRNLPISYVGELRDIELVQFSVELAELAPLLPAGIPPLVIGDRALISMVSVDLGRMHPTFLPSLFSFGYRHVAFRVLVDDGAVHEDGASRGVHFLRSFVASRWLVATAGLLTYYRLEHARVHRGADGLEVVQGGRRLIYRYASNDADALTSELLPDADAARALVAHVDRAYALDGNGKLRITQIVRDAWLLEPVAIGEFRNDFLSSARFEFAYRVPDVIQYRWQPPRKASFRLSSPLAAGQMPADP